MARYRRFSDAAMQQVYDDLRRSQPDDGESPYWLGYRFPNRPTKIARSSVAYATWAAGVDQASIDRAVIWRRRRATKAQRAHWHGRRADGIEFRIVPTTIGSGVHRAQAVRLFRVDDPQHPTVHPSVAAAKKAAEELS